MLLLSCCWLVPLLSILIDVDFGCGETSRDLLFALLDDDAQGDESPIYEPETKL